MLLKFLINNLYQKNKNVQLRKNINERTETSEKSLPNHENFEIEYIH